MLSILRLEDVYIGILSKKLKVNIINIDFKYLPNNQYSNISKKKKFEQLVYENKFSIFFIYEGDNDNYVFFWNLLILNDLFS